MPSRITIALIILFWLTTTAVVGYREIYPRFLSDRPPPIQIDLTDEATQMAPSLWTVFRGEEKIGSLTAQMEYDRRDDSFRFRNTYRELTFDFGAVRLQVPTLETVVRVGRDGHLRRQHLRGSVKALLREPATGTYVAMGGGQAVVDTQVVKNQLVGKVSLKKLGFLPDIEREIEPVPVTDGQILNPMMPVNRLQYVTPGRRWIIREFNPLGIALSAIGKELAKSAGAGTSLLPSHPPEGRELLAEVRSEPETVERRLDKPVDCWVIEYRYEQEVLARSWVAVADGRVMRQQAENFGERLRFDRLD